MKTSVPQRRLYYFVGQSVGQSVRQAVWGSREDAGSAQWAGRGVVGAAALQWLYDNTAHVVILQNTNIDSFLPLSSHILTL